MNKLGYVWLALACALTTLGCSDDDKDDTSSQSGPLEVIGEWESSFGDMKFPESITADAWGFASLIEYDNAKNVAITQSPKSEEDQFSETYSRLTWLEPKGDSFYYCTVDYGLETLEEARSTKAKADASDPDNGGCGENDFPWTKLTKTE